MDKFCLGFIHSKKGSQVYIFRADCPECNKSVFTSKYEVSGDLRANTKNLGMPVKAYWRKAMRDRGLDPNCVHFSPCLLLEDPSHG